MNDRERYQRYLCSREWSLLKEAVRSRCHGICERCHWKEMDACHHITYARKYNERIDDLQGLCNGCHQFIHGKLDVDPIDEQPLIFNSTEIRTVYLAGSITGTTWRDEIVDGWSYENHSPLYSGGVGEDWNVLHDVVRTNRRCKLHLTGPFWYAPAGGHGWCAAANRWSDNIVHANSNTVDNHGCLDFIERMGIYHRIWNALECTDLMFCWIDKPECYGTLVEVGLFAGRRFSRSGSKPIVIYSHPSIDLEDDHWMMLCPSLFHSQAATAGEAWSDFLNCCNRPLDMRRGIEIGS